MIERALKSDMDYGGVAAREKKAAAFIPYTRHATKDVLKTKEGHLLGIIKLHGIAYESADSTDLDIQKKIRATALQGLADSHFALYHHIIRTEVDDRQDSRFENSWCASLDRDYQEALADQKLFKNEHYLTLIRRPATSKAGHFETLTKKILNKVDHDYKAAREQEELKTLNDALSSLMSALEAYTPQRLGLYDKNATCCSAPLSFLSYLLNLERRDIPLPAMALDQYLPYKRISFGPERFETRGAETDNVKVGCALSIKDYKTSTHAGMLDALLDLPHEFILTQSFAFIDRQTAHSAISDITRKMEASEDGAISLLSELENAQDDLTSGRSHFGEHHLSLTLIAKSKVELDRAISQTNAEMIHCGLTCVREDVNLEASFWANLPGNFSYIARRAIISHHNFAGLASLHNLPHGQQDKNHWGTRVCTLKTLSQTPYHFNFHKEDVGNFTLIGPTGTGKTVLLTFLLAQSQRFSPKAIYFDKDRGAEIAIRAMGGHYAVIKQGKPTGFNPLQLEGTPENKAFLRAWLQTLLTLETKEPLNPHDLDMVRDAIEANFTAPHNHRRLSFVTELLCGYDHKADHTLADRLRGWHGQGARSWLFDNESDSLSLGHQTIGFDLTSILDDPVSRTPWLMYIFHRINQTLDGTRTVIMLDEGWKMLDDPVFSAHIKDWMKTIRKKNGLLGFATQSAKDAIHSAVGDAIIEQSATQIFLPNARAREEEYCKGFGLSLRELEIVRELSPASRRFLVRHGKDSIIAGLDLSSLAQHLPVLSGRTETIALLEQLIAQHGNDPGQWLPILMKGETP